MFQIESAKCTTGYTVWCLEEAILSPLVEEGSMCRNRCAQTPRERSSPLIAIQGERQLIAALRRAITGSLPWVLCVGLCCLYKSIMSQGP